MILSLSLILFACGDSKKENEDPVEEPSIESRVFDALTKSPLHTANHTIGDLSLDINQEALQVLLPDIEISDQLLSILNRVTLMLDSKSARDWDNYSVRNQTALNFLYEDMPLLILSIASDDQSISFAFDNFYDQRFGFNYSDLETLGSQDMVNTYNFDYSKYLKIIQDYQNKSIDFSAYESLIKNHLKEMLNQERSETLSYQYQNETFKEDLTAVDYTLDVAAVMQLIIDLADQAKDDEVIKNYVQNLTSDLLSEMMISRDYEILGLEKNEVEDMLSSVRDDFDEAWDEMINIVTEEMGRALDEVDDPDFDTQKILDTLKEDVTITLYLSQDDQIKRLSVHTSIEGIKVEANITVHAYDDDVQFSKSSDFIDLISLVEGTGPFETAESRDQVLRDFLTAVLETISNDKGFQAFFDDLRSVEDELGFSVDELLSLLPFAAGFIEEITFDDLFGYLDTGADDWKGNQIDFDWSHITLVTSEDYDPLSNYLMDDFGIETVYNEGSAEGLAEAVLSSADIIFVDDQSLAGMVEEYCLMYPNKLFVTLGFPLEFYYDNHFEVIYYDEEMSYVAGTIAGLMTTSGTIGFLGDQEDATTLNFYLAFEDGAKTADPNVEVLYRYTDNQPSEAYGLTEEMINEGADILYHYAGASAENMIQAADDYGVPFIQNCNFVGTESNNFLSITYRVVPTIIYDVVAYHDYYENYAAYGLYENMLAVYIDDLPEDVYNEVYQLIQDIQEENIVIPVYY
jgi:basic membrane protein A